MTLPPAPSKGPIFIVSPMGTGSTLLRLILDAHPNIAIPHETGFMRIYTSMRFVPFKLSGRRWAQRLGWTDQELDEEARQFFTRIFMRYAEQHGKVRWGEKTPQHLWHVAKMKRVFPDAVFIAIVRHPGAAAASNMRRFGHSVRWASLHARRYYREIFRLSVLHPHDMVVVRYEDLVAQPERLMRELLDWLGEPWADEVMQHHIVQSSRDHERIEGLSRADDPIDRERIARWTTQIEPGQVQTLARLERLANLWGYSFEDPTRVDPIGGADTLLFGGDDAARRIEQFADMDLMTRGEVPIPERHYHPRRIMPIPYPYERPRSIPGMPDVAEIPASPARKAISRVVRRTPRFIQRPARRIARRFGITPPTDLRKPEIPSEQDDPEI